MTLENLEKTNDNSNNGNANNINQNDSKADKEPASETIVKDGHKISFQENTNLTTFGSRNYRVKFIYIS